MEAKAQTPPRRPPRAVLTLLIFVAGAAIPYFVPGLARFRFARSEDLARLIPGRGRAPLIEWREEDQTRIPARRQAAQPSPPGPGGAAAPVVSARRTIGRSDPLPEAPEVPLEDDASAMDPFFSKLFRTERREQGAVTRISHFGDSPLTGDLISGEARVLFQRRFGNAGHGFVLAGRPWGWYGHNGVTLRSEGWRALSPILTWGDASYHGLGAVSFSARTGARTEISLDDDTFTRLEVTYLIRPGGGRFIVGVDAEPPVEVRTDGPERRSGAVSFRFPKGADKVSLAPKGDREVSLFGVVLEREGPGIVYDAVGANGATVHALTLLDADGWIQSLAERGSDLVILSYGTNESGYEGIPGPRYRKDWAEVIARIRKGLPGASILVMAPMDRGMRREDGRIVTAPSIPKIVEAQRQVAAETGCAFFDTFAAMGGEGTMARWYEREPRLVSGDLTHTTKGGSDRVARLLVGAIEDAYREWRAGNEPADPGEAGIPSSSN